MDKNYGKTRHLGRFVMQVFLESGYVKGITIHLLPQISLAFANRDVYFGVGLEWICGNVTFGFARQSYIKCLEDKEQQLAQRAEKQNLTVQQCRLSYWGW